MVDPYSKDKVYKWAEKEIDDLYDKGKNIVTDVRKGLSKGLALFMVGH